MIDYTKILQYKYLNAEWTLNGDDYEGLTWVSDTPKPSKATLDGLWQEVQDLIEAEAQAKAEAKAALLKRLGLTQEEFNTLTA
jgi:hypothetical protein